MLIIRDEKEIAKFILMLNSMNQILKNYKNNSTYTCVMGKCFIIKEDMEDILNSKIEFDFNGVRNRDGCNDFLKQLNGIIKGSELFSFFKEYKKYISKIILDDDKFIMETNSSAITYQSGSLKDNRKNDERNFKKFLKRINSYDKQFIKKISNYNKYIEKTKEVRKPVTIKHKLKDDTILRYRLTSNLFINFQKNSNSKLVIYELERRNNLYLLKFEIKEGIFTATNYIAIVNY